MNPLKKKCIGLAVLLTLFFTGLTVHADEFTTRDLNEEQILALSWVQNSAEFRALAYQAFNIAKLRWDADKPNNTFQMFFGEPPEKRAVIVDVDETLIDNSPFNAGLIGKDFGNGDSRWKEWCNDMTATTIPGAVEFLNHVVSTGGDVFYVTNRKAMPEKNIDLTEVTMKNLRALGFPQVDEKHMLLRTDTSKKQPRRDMVTDMGYRIVLLIGDNLADFDEAFDGDTMPVRKAATLNNKDQFGDKFIVLPNPIYGNWEAAVYGGGKWYKKSAREKSDIRIDTLRKFEFSE